jgi:hypothetical protein
MIDRQAAFEKEFKALLRKYNVEMSPIEGWCGYAVTVDGVNFYSSACYVNGEATHSAIDINFGRWEDGK